MKIPAIMRAIAFLTLLGGLVLLGILIATSFPWGEGLESSGILSHGSMFISLILSMLCITIGVGLYMLKKWAWFGKIALLAVSFLYDFGAIIKINQFESRLQVLFLFFTVLFHIVVLAYMMRKDIRQLYKVAT